MMKRIVGFLAIGFLLGCNQPIKPQTSFATSAGGYEVDVLALSSYSGGCTCAVRILNISGAAITSFEVGFAMSGITPNNSYNGTIAKSGSNYIATNPSWLTYSPVKSGNKWEVGFNGSGTGLTGVSVTSLKINGTAITLGGSTPPPADTVAPTVSLATSSSSVFAASSLTLTATAADNTGVSKVDFYDGTTLISSDATSPYSVAVSLTSVNNGTKSYSAKASDAAGNTATSAAVSVTVNIPATTTGTVSVGALTTSSASVTAAGSVTLSTTASAVNTTVSKVEFLNGTTVIATDTTSPYSASIAFTTADNGTKSYTARATGANGAVATSSATSVVVNIPTGGTGGSGCTSASICDDFESSSTLGSQWSLFQQSGCANGVVSVDSAQAHSGTKSVKVVAGANYCDHGFFGLTDMKGLGAGNFYGRYFVRFLNALPEGHVTFMTMRDSTVADVNNASLRMGGQLQAMHWNRQSDDATIPSVNAAGVAQSVKPTAAKWYCVEFRADGPNSQLQAWVDGSEVMGMKLDATPTPDVDQQFINQKANWKPSFANVFFGWESYGGVGNTLWFDDVAVSSSRIGCN